MNMLRSPYLALSLWYYIITTWLGLCYSLVQKGYVALIFLFDHLDSGCFFSYSNLKSVFLYIVGIFIYRSNWLYREPYVVCFVNTFHRKDTDEYNAQRFQIYYIVDRVMMTRTSRRPLFSAVRIPWDIHRVSLFIFLYPDFISILLYYDIMIHNVSVSVLSVKGYLEDGKVFEKIFETMRREIEHFIKCWAHS